MGESMKLNLQIWGALMVVFSGCSMVFFAFKKLPITDSWAFLPVMLGLAILGLGLYMFGKVS